MKSSGALLFIVFVLVVLLVFTIIDQRGTVEECYRILESHNEALILHTQMINELVEANQKATDMLEAIIGKMIWEMEW